MPLAASHGPLRIAGVRVAGDAIYRARAVVLCAGTFMQGLLHVGETTMPGGRIGEPTSAGISQALSGLGFELARFKTGTPPRIDGRTIDYAKTELQPGDERARAVLLPHRADRLPADSLLDHLHHARGPRADPRQSAPRADVQRADPIDRAALLPLDRDQDRSLRRQAAAPAVSGAGRTRIPHEVYINGLSTSLPRDVQDAMLRLIPGLERAEILRYGYAIEYDYLPPLQLQPSLETKRVAGLVLCRPDQRHHRLRRGRRPGTHRRRQRRARRCGAKSRWCSAAIRPTSA